MVCVCVCPCCSLSGQVNLHECYYSALLYILCRYGCCGFARLQYVSVCSSRLFSLSAVNWEDTKELMSVCGDEARDQFVCLCRLLSTQATATTCTSHHPITHSLDSLHVASYLATPKLAKHSGVRWRSSSGGTWLPTTVKGSCCSMPSSLARSAACLHTSSWRMDEDKSVLEKAVDTLKEKKSKKVNV